MNTTKEENVNNIDQTIKELEQIMKELTKDEKEITKEDFLEHLNSVYGQYHETDKLKTIYEITIETLDVWVEWGSKEEETLGCYFDEWEKELNQ